MCKIAAYVWKIVEVQSEQTTSRKGAVFLLETGDAGAKTQSNGLDELFMKDV